MKKLTRVKLVNWYSFSDETISFGDTTLLTGQNAAGKSTVLDAMQLVVTQNQKHFNAAGNDTSKRDIRGYVRYRVGKENATYVRNGYVISYVALEFLEEKTGRYFVVGVKLDSPSETDPVRKKWFSESCKLEDLSFIIEGRPAKDKEFKNSGKAVSFISQDTEAVAKFRSLFGKLDHRFAELIPKALGLKTVSNITNFVNDFLLPEAEIDVEKLSCNISILRDLQRELEDMEDRKEQLKIIQEIYQKYSSFIEEKGADRILLELISKAQLEEKKKEEETRKRKLEDNISFFKVEEGFLSNILDTSQSKLNGLIIARDSDNNSQLIRTIEEKIRTERMNETRLAEDEAKLIKQVQAIQSLISSPFFLKNDSFAADTEMLLSAGEDCNTKEKILSDIESISLDLEEKYKARLVFVTNELAQTKKKIECLTSSIAELKTNVRSYPFPGVKRLKAEIEKEFQKRRIESDVYVFADRLEIVDGMEEWRNAVECFLGKRRFNIIVAPEFYDIALEVYDRYKNEICDVALVNTKKLRYNEQVDKTSLAAVVQSNNKYIAGYAAFLLGDITRCDSVRDLEHYHKAITRQCMIYTQLAVSKMNLAGKTNFIGQNALSQQIEDQTSELENLQYEKDQLETEEFEIKNILSVLKNCHFDIVREYIRTPQELFRCRESISRYEKELEEANADLSVVEIQTKIENAEKEVAEYKEKAQEKSTDRKIAERDVENCKELIRELTGKISEKQEYLSSLKSESRQAYEMSVARFEEEILNQVELSIALKKIESKKATLDRNINKTRDMLVEHQLRYCGGEYGSGPEAMERFNKEWDTLSDASIEDKKDIIKQFEEKNIIQFKESFLSKMRENIIKAQNIMESLNYRMKGVFYGNDSYQFKIEANKDKIGLYKMIMSDMNAEGPTLFSSVLEADYRAEMEELFDKIRVSGDTDMKIVREYTDYRSYLQYDIIIKNKAGETKLFSKNSGYASGGETQTPCYVTLISCFNQAYDVSDETIKLIFLDEAFSKMDNNRISSLMSFLTSQNFQFVIAAPPDKTSIINDYVDTINIVMKDKDDGVSVIMNIAQN